MHMNRRQVVQTLGWGGATLLVGCNITPAGTVTPSTGELSTSTATTNCAGTITLSLKLKSNIGEIIKVEFYQGTTLLGTSTTAPYNVEIAAGTLTRGSDSEDDEDSHEYHRYFTAKIYLKDGTVVSSNKIRVNIKKDCGTTDSTSPTVSLTASSSNVTAVGKVTLTATASDNVGVSKVEFYEGATLLGTKSAAPYSFDLSFTAANNGTHNYIVKAYDAANNSASSSSVTVVVNIGGNPSDTTPPTVSLASSSLSVTAAGSITLTATANDNVGVSKVEFYEGATLLGTRSAAPFTQSITFAAANNGTHNYTAKAYDAAGNTASSTPAVSVVVNIPAATTGTKVAALTDFPSVGSWKDFAAPLGSDVGGLVYRSSALEAGGIAVNGMNLVAFSRHCTHQGCDVLDVGPDANHILTCPCHQATFNLEAGAAPTAPAKTPLATLTIKAFADGIYLQ